MDASLQFFEERSSRRQRQQIVDYGNNQPIQLYSFFFFENFKKKNNEIYCFSFRPCAPLMSPINPTMLCSPPLENYPPNPNWIPPSSLPPSTPSSSSSSRQPMFMSSDQMQLQHRLSVNVTDHYEWTTNPSNYFPGYSAQTNSSNLDTMSLNGSLSSNTSTNDSSPYPILAPMPTVFFNQYPQQLPNEQTYMQPILFTPQQISPGLINEQTQQNMINDPSGHKFVFVFLLLEI